VNLRAASLVLTLAAPLLACRAAADASAMPDAASGGPDDSGGADTDTGTDTGAGAGVDADQGASPCAPRPGLVFCDDFETRLAFPDGPWSTGIIGAGTVTVDGMSPAHSGMHAAHVQDGDNDYDTLLVLHDPALLPVAGGRLYLRAFIKLGRAMSAGHNSYVLADLYAMQGQGNNLRLGEDNGMLMETVMGDAHGALSHNNYYNDHQLGVVFTPGTWTCVEVLLDSGAPEIDVWVDGVEVPDLHHTDWPLDPYDNVRFGFEKYYGPAAEIWYDDIAIGTQRIGCGAP
jgi:hypothetical protein